MPPVDDPLGAMFSEDPEQQAEAKRCLVGMLTGDPEQQAKAKRFIELKLLSARQGRHVGHLSRRCQSHCETSAIQSRRYRRISRA